MTGDATGERGGARDERWVDEVLSFWFEELAPEAWFRNSEVTDALIRDRFLDVYETVAELSAEAAWTGPRRALATVIVLDQYPRNMFRGTPAAFAADGRARDVALGAVERGFDRSFDIHGRAFMYLPLEHSENPADQERSVALFTPLGNEEYTRYAVAHRDIIARFGRFPHRNVILGRPSTPEEKEFLQQPGSSF
ncbi:MAG: DUF924 family protein [Hyphomicrobiaceae bacterium]|nr:DUF924 family protein [Hyphomicrobiaceae bacterium]